MTAGLTAIQVGWPSSTSSPAPRSNGRVRPVAGNCQSLGQCVERAGGIGRGDRVGLLLPQGPEVAASHIAVFKLGAMGLPGDPVGAEALRFRLRDASVKAIVADAAGASKVASIREELGELSTFCSSFGAAEGAGGTGRFAGAGRLAFYGSADTGR